MAENINNINKKSILDIEEQNLTPGMKQYRDVKKQNPDCLVMLRMGDFFEMFYEDAVTAAKELEITLTQRGKGEKRAPLAGVPYHALETYLGKLVKKGHKVAIVEQLEDPKKAKGLVKRGLVRIVTPGTLIDSSMLEETENNYIMSLTSFADDFAVAFCDLSTGEFFTTTIDSMNLLISEIVRLNPSECVIPESLMVNQELIKQIKNNNCFINSLEDYYFKSETSKEIILNHFNLPSLDSFGLEDKKLNLSVSGALMKYLIDTQKNTLSHIKKISVSSRDKMIIDASTLRNLELTKNIKDHSLKGTLLSVLNKTVTAMGSRLLKKWIKEPLLNKKAIENRLNAIEALNNSVIVREEVITLLNEVYDLERLISRVNYGNANPRDLLALKHSLQQFPEIQEKLSSLDSDLLQKIAGIPSLQEITTLINSAIRDEAPITIREGNIIKGDYNSELAELLDIKTNSKKFLQQIEEREKKKTGISTLKIGFTRVFGYFIEVTKKNLHLVPETYIRKQTTANSERYITEELKLEEEKILGAQEKIQVLEYDLFQDLIKKIAEKTSEIQDSAQKLAVLDVVCSLAKTAMENNYCKPQFVEEKVIQLRNSRHPVVEILESKFVANDIVMGQGEMMIVTGANMSGKSTMQRQVALIILMAQLGSFVPADEAVLGITDRIFTRVGASDDLVSGQSTFMVEMNETASILNNATENSLIILDEIGRGTSTFDGVSIAWSVAEHIYNQIKAKTLFSTHYHVMNKLEEKFTKIKNYYLVAKEVRGEIVFLYKLMAGGSDQSFGVHVAKLAGLPSEVISRAEEIQRILEKDDEMVGKIKAKKLQEQMILKNFK
ncbi:DNA mismatch repair protein MutS [Candidatus Woesearchaeota archaeon]|nr:DNA mismatch repair protein MutS [Candidatus Woesearchaeota archaeon]MBT4110842.1 DNA mismatch repair protein MutS [Candidatus Woesearchaeota archaeon]MBT4336646.1 DNA mismatch repair protein MutS [Candidatus Woesearchaeota archaeon]MBT6743967.1 DNA mismatch repair protein MutS [Candidatus Woesearchaeota archaeon]